MQQAGFVLIEVIVTTVIISLLIGLLASAWPATRQRQALVLAEQQVQFLIHEAERKSLNDDKSDKCLQKVNLLWPGDTSRRSRCSDWGVYLSGNKVALFADIAGNLGIYDGAQEYVEQSTDLPNGVTVDSTSASMHSLAFQLAPPQVKLFIEGQASYNQQMILWSGKATDKFTITSYGNIKH